jgi:hypothetical protein
MIAELLAGILDVVAGFIGGLAGERRPPAKPREQETPLAPSGRHPE